MTFLPKRLLCLVDLSQVSPAVLSWARLLASTYRAEIEVFHAIWAPKSGAEGAEINFEILGTEIEGRVNALCDEAFGKELKYVSTVAQGHPVKTVLQHIEQSAPDLIVLGSHGYDGYGEVLLGSVAENVMRKAKCPVLIVKGAPLASNTTSLKTIQSAVDLGDFSRYCLLRASELATMLESELHVTFVAPPFLPVKEARSALEAWIPDPVWSNTEVRDVVLQGDPAEKLVKYARDKHCALIVVAGEHRPFLEYTTLGRTTERVLRFCPCTALMIPKIDGKPDSIIIEPAQA